jgi:hypothetical protein
MIFRALQYRHAIRDTIFDSQNRKFIDLLLNDYDWALMESLLKICKPLKVSEKGHTMCITKVNIIYV